MKKSFELYIKRSTNINTETMKRIVLIHLVTLFTVNCFSQEITKKIESKKSGDKL